MSEDKNKSTTGKTTASLESSEILETHPGDEVLAIALTDRQVKNLGPTPDLERPTKDTEPLEESIELRDIKPFSREFLGIPTSYFSVGFVQGGLNSPLYPYLIVLNDVSSAYYTSAGNLVSIFWSYKIFYGIFYDIYYPLGMKFKPWICFGWTCTCAILLPIAIAGNNISVNVFVILLTVANFLYVAADTAADGFQTWVTKREQPSQRGNMTALVYQSRFTAGIVIAVVVMLSISGPKANCPGYEPDANIACTTDTSISSRNSEFAKNPTDWCHMQCDSAMLDFGVTINQFYWILFGILTLFVPIYFFFLKEDKKQKPTEGISKIISHMTQSCERRAVWQLILYSLVMNTLFGVSNAAITNANFVWLDLTTTQNQIMSILDNIILAGALHYMRKRGLDFSWRKIMFWARGLVLATNLIYLLIVYDVIRNSWFYVVFSVSEEFIYASCYIVPLWPIAEVAEPGFESMTYALITTAGNVAGPLSTVLSQQLLSFFPALQSQDTIKADTPEVRNQMMGLFVLTEVINFSALLCLPMLPRQRKETRQLVKEGGTSSFWGKFGLISGLVALIYSSIISWVTVADPKIGCLNILGGTGCKDASAVSAKVDYAFSIVLMAMVFLYCYVIIYIFTIRGQKVQWSNYI